MSFEIVSVDDGLSLLKAKDYLLKNKPICAPTDTIYGLLAVDNEETLDYLHKIRRPSKKPFLRLLPDLSYLRFYGFYENDIVKTLSNIEGVSIVLKDDNKSIGFRVPKSGFIRHVLEEVRKPILAPSCNKEGEPPAISIKMAIDYFKEEVPLYIDGGIIERPPSTIIEIYKDNISIIREGINFEKVKNIIKNL